MITVIICYRDENLIKILCESIENTIGTEYETILIDNSNNAYSSISAAYNYGIKISKYSTLCFIHEDVEIITNGWGSLLVNYFEDREIGLVGLAGSTLFENLPIAWWENNSLNNHINIIQKIDSGLRIDNFGWKENDRFLKNISAIDGVFIAMNRNIGITFNDSIDSFHCYDQAISIECFKAGFKIGVTNEILIVHSSTGNINSSWYYSIDKLLTIYKNDLPIKGIGSNIIDFHLKVNLYILYIEGCLQNNLRSIAKKYWFKLVFLKPFSSYHIKFLKKWFL
jgi:hypothetical protein